MITHSYHSNKATGEQNYQCDYWLEQKKEYTYKVVTIRQRIIGIKGMNRRTEIISPSNNKLR